MKREIKYRAWVPSEKRMGIPFDPFDNADGGLFPSDVIFTQYTGLKDKNGKEIYEGDIIQTGTDKLMVVGWKERYASFVIERDGWMFDHYFGEAFEAQDCEVVGNIYENPELLK